MYSAIYGMRNIISHEYANIDEEIVVSVIQKDLPKLKIVIEELLHKYSSNSWHTIPPKKISLPFGRPFFIPPQTLTIHFVISKILEDKFLISWICLLNSGEIMKLQNIESVL